MREAVRVEAIRLALSAPTRGLQQPEQAAKKSERHWCRRHLVGYGALVGLAGGFLVGLVAAPENFALENEAGGFALIFGGPIGAGIGAATGGIIWAYTEPEQP